MALFEIYKRIGKSGRHDGNILILKDKISILALIFPPLWLIINRNFFLIPIYFLAIFQKMEYRWLLFLVDNQISQ